jgi:hypothetical protein
MRLPTTTGKKDFAMSTEKNTVPVITSVKNSQGEEVPDGGTTRGSVVHLSGLAPAGDELEIFDAATMKGLVVATAAGTWLFELKDLSVKTYSIKAIGRGLHSNTRRFTVAAK